jgi:ribonuclease VapC
MFVDASAILAILCAEADGATLAAALEAEGSRKPITSAVAGWEAAVGLNRKKRLSVVEAESCILEFLDTAKIEMVDVSAADLPLALKAFDRYGRHRYPEAERNRALNLADCFHYACAKSRHMPILHTDAGLSLTDVPSVL